LSPQKIVFVCSGNTCRSPLAMALARSFWQGDPLFSSAGLQTVAGQSASKHALAVAGEHDLDLSEHRSRPLDDEVIEQADWLIGMTRAHVALLKSRLGAQEESRIGLLSLANLDLSDGPVPEAQEVSDPYGGDLDVYRTTTDQIARLLRPWGETFTRGETEP
jgi:protein-tyrosine-phosphatase